MFYIKDVNYGEKADVGDRKIADYIVAPTNEGEPIREQHKIRGIYVEQRDGAKSGGLKEVALKPGERFSFFPYFPEMKKQNHRLIVSGRSGSGKSWVIGMVLDQMAYIYPKHDIIIISFVDEDEALDRPRGGRKPIRLNLEDPMVLNMTPAFFEESIVVFDDIERGMDKTIVKFLLNLRAMMFEVARHYNTHIISVSHDLLGGNINKTVRAEATGVFLFPQYNQPHQSMQYLKKYVGLSMKQVEEVMKLPSRWVYLSLLSPTYYITNTTIKLLI